MFNFKKKVSIDLLECLKGISPDIEVKFTYDEDEESIIKAEEFSEGLSFEDFFSFQNFIVGSANRFAHAVSLADSLNLPITTASIPF